MVSYCHLTDSINFSILLCCALWYSLYYTLDLLQSPYIYSWYIYCYSSRPIYVLVRDTTNLSSCRLLFCRATAYQITTSVILWIWWIEQTKRTLWSLTRNHLARLISFAHIYKNNPCTIFKLCTQRVATFSSCMSEKVKIEKYNWRCRSIGLHLSPKQPLSLLNRLHLNTV